MNGAALQVCEDRIDVCSGVYVGAITDGGIGERSGGFWLRLVHESDASFLEGFCFGEDDFVAER